MADYETLVAALAGTGATLVLFTGFDVKVSAAAGAAEETQRLLQPARPRDRRPYGAVLVDYWCFDAFHDPRMWDSDRLHMSKAGHKYLAAQVLDHLGVPHKIKPKEWEPPVKPGLREWERRQRRWVARLGAAPLRTQAPRRHPRRPAPAALARAREGPAQGRPEEAVQNQRAGDRRRRLAARTQLSSRFS